MSTIVVDVILFIIVFGSILFIAFTTTRYIGGRAGKAMKGRYLESVESIGIGLGNNIHLLKAGDQFILISSSGKNVQFLTTISIDNYQIDVAKNAIGTSFEFKGIFEKYINFLKYGKGDKSIEEGEEGSNKQKSNNSLRGNLNKLKKVVSKMENTRHKSEDEKKYAEK